MTVMDDEHGKPGTRLSGVAQYYSEKLRTHGPSPRGVDWNGSESQKLRFSQLLAICGDRRSGFSLNDYGCGYGGLLEYMTTREFGAFTYEGFDIADEMIAASRAKFSPSGSWHFHCGTTARGVADYAVASGIFNVRLDADGDAWERHVLATIADMDSKSSSGFAFNCLTRYSDAHLMKDYLYYADPCRLFDFCKTSFSRNVALLHDYGLYEFTILVRKDV